MSMRPMLVATMLVALCGDVASAQAQSTVLPFERYAAQVRAQHPVARQAALAADQARAEQQRARGGFEPVLSAAWDRKTFGSTEYYDYATAKLTAPTPYGVDVVLGYERAQGAYISPDRRTPGAGLVTAGLSIPIGQRMVTDERRTALAVARALRTAVDADREAIVNKLLVTAAKDYAGWYEAHRRAAIAADGLALAEFRMGAVRRRVEAGESAAIDTVEAALEVRRRAVQRAEAEQEVFAARLLAEAHLWDARGEPASLPANAVPEATLTATPAAPLDSAEVARWASLAERAHPEVRKAEGYADQTGAQRRLAAQGMLPAIDVYANALAERTDGLAFTPGATSSDAKVGASAKVAPLMLQARGRFAFTDARDEQQRIEVARVRRDVVVTLRRAANDLVTLDLLLATQREAVEQARLLRAGEQRRFEAGESTLFLVNARERLVLDEEMKLAAFEAKRLVAGATLDAARGGPGVSGRAR